MQHRDTFFDRDPERQRDIVRGIFYQYLEAREDADIGLASDQERDFAWNFLQGVIDRVVVQRELVGTSYEERVEILRGEMREMFLGAYYVHYSDFSGGEDDTEEGTEMGSWTSEDDADAEARHVANMLGGDLHPAWI